MAFPRRRALERATCHSGLVQLSTPYSLYPVLISWFNEHGRDLPWRRTTDAWAILVCEVMSQQTPVSRVLPTWEYWMERWPTPGDLAASSPTEVLLAWDKMGYPRRAMRLLECARTVTEVYDGVLPRTRDELLALPGIGSYTADAIIAFAYHERSVVLDTNIRRVLARWHGEALPRPTQTRAEVVRADTFVPENPNEAWQWNAAIMELGALMCTARNPRCESCPFTSVCQWFQAGKPADEFATKRKPQGFAGTNRQARGQIMAILRDESSPSLSPAALMLASGLPKERFDPALTSLLDDGLAVATDGLVSLPS